MNGFLASRITRGRKRAERLLCLSKDSLLANGSIQSLGYLSRWSSISGSVDLNLVSTKPGLAHADPILFA